MIGIVQDKRAFPDPEVFFGLAMELGARHIEFKYEERLANQYGLKGETALRLRDMAQARGVTLSIHAPYDDGISFGDPRAEVNARTRQQMEDCLDFAHRIDARYITVHGGSVEVEPDYEVKAALGQPNRVTLRDKAPKATFEALKERTYKDLSWFIAEGRARDVAIALENYHDFSFFRLRYPILPEDFQECKQVLGEELFINFDTGHAHSTGIHILDFMNQIGPENILGTHLHDNHQFGDEHLPIFFGTIDFEAFFQAYHQGEWQFPLNIEAKDQQDLMISWHLLQAQVLAKSRTE